MTPYYRYIILYLLLYLPGMLNAQYGTDMRQDTLTRNDRIDETRTIHTIAEDKCKNLHLVFTRRHYPPGSGFSKSVVVYAYKPFGKGWGFEKVISDTSINSFSPSIHINPITQRPHIFYQGGVEFDAELYEARMEDSSSWQVMRRTNNNTGDSDPSFVFDKNGTPHYTWIRKYTNDSLEVVYAGGTNLFHTPLPIKESRKHAPIVPHLTISDNGTVHIAYRAWVDADNAYAITYASKPAGQNNFGIEMINIPGREHEFTVYLKAHENDVHFMISSRNGLSGFFQTHYLKKDLISGTWTPPVPVSIYSGEASELFIDRKGSIHFILNRVDDGGFCGTGSYCWISGYIVYVSNETGVWKSKPVVYDLDEKSPLLPGDFFNGSLYFDADENTYLIHNINDNISMNSSEIRILSDYVSYDNVEKVVEEIPNVFTPNDDGINDVFEYRLHASSTFDLKIYNRWGNIVFETTDRAVKWDGTTNGKPVPAGVYYYILTTNEYTTNECGVTLLDSDRTKTGTITLLR